MKKSKGIFWLEYGDNRLKRITRFLYKWLWCSWQCNSKKIDGPNRCYPEVWGRGLNGPWHCTKCHPCGEYFDWFTSDEIRGWF